jgi:hypothetical protein
MELRARHWWLTLVILATQEAEIRSITVGSQSRQIVCETLSQKSPSQNRAGRVAQGEGLEFKPQYHKKKKCSLVTHSRKQMEVLTHYYYNHF